MRLVLSLGSAENRARLPVITIAKRDTTQGTVLSLKKTLQKTSNGLNNYANYHGK